MQTSPRMRQLTAVALAFPLAIGVLAGCSTNSASDEAKVVTESGQAVTIEYLHRLPDGEGMTKVADIVAKWNAENPDVQVTATKFTGKADEMIKKLETDVKAGNAPCLAQLGYAEVPEMFTKGLLEDVTAFAGEYKSNFGGTFEQMNVGGTYVGLPQDSGPLVYVYNKKAFEELGLTVPTNAEELVATAQKAAASGKYILDFEPDEVLYWLTAQAASAGSNLYSVADDKWKVDFLGEGSQKVADTWQTLLDSKAVLTNPRWDDSFKQAIADGTLIGTIAAAWEPALIVSDFGEDAAHKGNWAVAQLPDFGAGAKTGPDGGSGVAVMKGCATPEAAMKFNNWLNTQVADLATQGLVPAALGTVETPANQKEFFGGQDIYAEFTTANKNMVPVNYIPGFSTLRDRMGKAADAAVAGTGTVKAIFEAAQEDSIKALKDLNLPVAE